METTVTSIPDDNSNSGKLFSYLKSPSGNSSLPKGPELPAEIENKPKKRRMSKKSDSTEIIKANNNDVLPANQTIHSYDDTNRILRETITEIDIVSIDIKNELDKVRASKTMKSKYNYISQLSGNLGMMLSTKVAAVRELNNSIKNSNELDYKKQKDMDAFNNQNNDLAIQNLYNAFISNPANQGIAGKTALGPTTMDMSVAGSTNIVRVGGDNSLDTAYQNFKSNMSPEVNRMILESNPNIKDVVVYDQATGNKYFDVVDMSTNQSVPNVPVRDAMFLEDCTIDTRNRIARNVNLNEVYPLIILNEGKPFGEY